MSDPDLRVRNRLTSGAGRLRFDVDAALRSAVRASSRRSTARRVGTILAAATITAVAVVAAGRLLGIGTAPRPASAPVGRLTYMRVTIPDDGSSLIDAYVANGDGSDATALDTPLRWEIFPALSPDGSSIAFAGGPSEQSLDLYVAAPDGSHPRSIVAGGVEWPIAWSPDSSRIAFVRRAPEGDAIWIVKADSAEAHRVLEGSWTGVAWSPTGEGLAVTGAPPSPTGNKENGYGLYVVQPDGSGLRRLTSSEADPAAEVFDYWPAWSPDGRHIAFARNDALDDITYDSDVYVMGADGSDLRRLTDWPGLDTVPAWSPDGRSLLFTSDRRLTPEQRNQNRERGELRGVSIYSLDLASGNVDLVIEGGGGGAAIFPTSWVR